MHSEILNWLASDSGWRVLIGLVVLLLLGGIGFPIPEDIPVILGGVAIEKGVVSWQAMFLTCYVSIIAADLLVFSIGYFFGKKLIAAGTRSRIFSALTEDRVQQTREALHRHRLWVIFAARHLFPIRSATFLAAGSLHVPILQFLIADALAALVSVSLVLWLGYFLGGTLTPEVISHLFRQWQYYALGLIAFILLCALAPRLWRKKEVQQKPPLQENQSVKLAEGNVTEKIF